MKKIFGISILILFVFMGLIFYLFQKREYFYLTDDKCVTVWKTAEGAYIIPGKYTSWFKPKNNCNYIKTTNTKYLTFYYIEKSPEKIIVRDQGQEGNIGGYEIKNYVSSSPIFVQFSDDYKKILYLPNAIKFNDLEYGVNYLDVNVFENYARTNDGRILK